MFCLGWSSRCHCSDHTPQSHLLCCQYSKACCLSSRVQHPLHKISRMEIQCYYNYANDTHTCCSFMHSTVCYGNNIPCNILCQLQNIITIHTLIVLSCIVYTVCVHGMKIAHACRLTYQIFLHLLVCLTHEG